MPPYLPRLVDRSLADRLTHAGAVVIEGAKATGKTETGRQAAASEVRLDEDEALRALAVASPQAVLEGASPRLIDEWQAAPGVWNAVRREVDRRQSAGQFILTGSATPADDLTRHSGLGRFSRMRMRPLAMVETGHSSNEVSLRDLLEGGGVGSSDQQLDLRALAGRMLSGGWPAGQDLELPQAARYAQDYLEQAALLEVAGLGDVRHNPRRVAALLRSIARTSATEASAATLATDAGGADGPLHQATVAAYLDALTRAYLVEVQEAWDLPLRTRTPLRKAPKRHLVDSSLAAAALRISTPEQLLADPRSLGQLFESFAYQQLRALADANDADVFHLRSKTGLEVDAIVERRDGAWAAFEVKLGAGLVEEGVASLQRFAATIDPTHREQPATLAVLLPSGPSYRRPDGIAVVSLTTLGA